MAARQALAPAGERERAAVVDCERAGHERQPRELRGGGGALRGEPPLGRRRGRRRGLALRRRGGVAVRAGARGLPVAAARPVGPRVLGLLPREEGAQER